MSLSIDFETRSRINLKTAGAYRYAEDPSTDIWCMAFAFDDEEPGLFYFRENEMLADGDTEYGSFARIVKHITSGGEVRAWNAAFERLIWTHILPRYCFPIPKTEQFVCSAAEAAAMALPRKLKDAARVLNVADQVADEKNALIQQMAKPRKPSKKDPREWWDYPEKLEQLYEACKNDVRAERAVAKRLRRLSDYERAVYLADQRCNDRGVMIDRPLVVAARQIVATGMQKANAQLEQVTGGAVASVTKVAGLKSWLQQSGLEVDDLRKDTIRDLLAGEGPELTVAQQEVLSLRSESAKSSTAKINAMLACVCGDDRARGLHLYHGAATGRDAGRLIQPQNFPRAADPMSGNPTVKNIENYIPAVLGNEYEVIDMEHPPLIVIATMLRSMLIAAPGRVLMAADYAQIEARVLAWIAEQNDLVHAFATGGKIYEPMAARIYDVPVEEITKDDPRRQIGKVTVLGAGFQMGAETFREQTKVQTGVDLSEEIAEKAIEAYRALNAEIKSFWWRINEAAKRAVMLPGEVVSCGRGGAIRYVVRGKFLWCFLPSGRPLAYALPRIERRVVKPKNKEPFETTSVTFAGVDNKTRQWKRHAGYGGLWTENVVQAMARDLLMAGMMRAEAHNYPVVLRVHDEIVCEVPKGFGSVDELCKLMEVRPRWAHDLPVAAEGWMNARYRK